MSLTTERLKRVDVTNLCALINVADEQYFLQKYMSPESFEECMAGDTNMTRVQILCEKMVHEMTAGNMDLYDALCAYFLERSEAYKCMYQRFTSIVSSNSANSGSSSNDVQSELLYLQERVKELTEELMHLHEAEKEPASLSDESVPVYADVVANNPMEVEKLEPEVVAALSLLIDTQLFPCPNDNNPMSCDWMKPDTDVKPNVKEEIQTADDVPALTGDDKENDNDEADASNETTNHGYQCEYCDKKFRYNSHFVDHVRTHTGEKPFACQYCEKRFSVKVNLRRHVRTHTGEKPFACKECDRRFSQNITLLEHCRTHTGEKPFACKNCGKKFARKQHLLQHSRIHTGDRPYVCEHCEMAFRFKSGLRQHLLNKHSHDTLKKRKPVHVASSSS